MRESPDRTFDADLARKLKFNTMVNLRQQQCAKERLLRCAAEQIVLPPQRVEAHVTLRDHAAIFGQQALRFLNFLILDTSVYERARRPAGFCPLYAVPGRYSLIRVCA